MHQAITQETNTPIRQIELSDVEIRKIIAILRFSKDVCPIESIPGNIDEEEVERLVIKFEKYLPSE